MTDYFKVQYICQFPCFQYFEFLRKKLYTHCKTFSFWRMELRTWSMPWISPVRSWVTCMMGDFSLFCGEDRKEKQAMLPSLCQSWLKIKRVLSRTPEKSFIISISGAFQFTEFPPKNLKGKIPDFPWLEVLHTNFQLLSSFCKNVTFYKK